MANDKFSGARYIKSAKIEHTCENCKRKINVGESYAKEHFFADKKFSKRKLCQQCYEKVKDGYSHHD